MPSAIDSSRAGLATVLPADGFLLNRVLDATFSSDHQGLDRSAYTAWDSAQRKAPWALAHQRRFALVKNDAVLAAAQRYDLSGTLDGESLSICAIGSVWSATGPSGSDAGSLIEQLIQDAKTDGADFVLLFLSAEQAVAVPPRFVRIPTLDLEINVSESPRHGAPMMLVRAGDDRDLTAIVAMGEVRSSRSRFHLDRDAALVKHVITRRRLLAGLGPSGGRQLEFVIAEEGATAAAYVVLSRAGDQWTIEECGDRDPSGVRVGAILQALIAREPAERRPVIRGWLPPGFMPPQISIASAVPSVGGVFARFIQPKSTTLRLTASEIVYWRSDCF